MKNRHSNRDQRLAILSNGGKMKENLKTVAAALEGGFSEPRH